MSTPNKVYFMRKNAVPKSAIIENSCLNASYLNEKNSKQLSVKFNPLNKL